MMSVAWGTGSAGLGDFLLETAHDLHHDGELRVAVGRPGGGSGWRAVVSHSRRAQARRIGRPTISRKITLGKRMAIVGDEVALSSGAVSSSSSTTRSVILASKWGMRFTEK